VELITTFLNKPFFFTKMLKTDLHLHTDIIKHFDSHIKPKDLIDRAAKLDFDVLAITEHTAYKSLSGTTHVKNPLSTYNQWKEYAKKKGILLIPSVELLVEGKEILLINFVGNPEKYSRIEELEKLKKENTTIIAPHPYFPGSSCLKNKLVEHIKIFDAIEYSHFYLRHLNPNKKAEEIAIKYKKPMIATSDAHFLFEIGKNYSFIEAEKNTDSILNAIEKNRIKIVTRPLGIGKFSLLFSYQIYSKIMKELL